MPHLKMDISDRLDLPSAPVIVKQLNTLLSRDDAGSHELAQVVETDPAFTARILKLVNSPFYGFARQIISVEEAITMLGRNAVHQLLLATSVLSSLGVDSRVLDLRQFWMHSFAVGVLGKNLLVGAQKDLQHDVFVCGILHDIGRLVFIKMDASKYCDFYNQGQSVTDLDEETRWFGTDHQKVGRMLAQKWNFPESLSNAIGFHHSPDVATTHQRLVAVISISDMLCHALNIGHSGNVFVSYFSPDAWKLLGVPMEDLESIINRALDEIEQAEAFIQEIH